MRGDIRAFLFDLDGTLVETGIDFRRMRKETLLLVKRYGVPAKGICDLDILALVDRAAAWLLEERGESDASDFRCEAEHLLREIEMPFCRAAMEIEGGVELLVALRERGIGVGIVTRNCRQGVEEILRRIPLSFDVLLTRNDVAKVKPDPEHLWMALKALGVEPARAIMVGDHWMDVWAGKNAGTKTAGYLAPDKPENYFARAEPDVVVRGLSELSALLT